MTVIHNSEINGLIKPAYSLGEVRAISSLLEERGALTFRALPNGLFPAAALGSDRSYTGYSYVWVRDNIHIAHAHYRTGRTAIAAKNLQTLMQYFIQHQHRFLAIIANPLAADQPMNRPHIRFKGDSLEEVNEKWAHAQNDALGYFLWMFCKLVNEAALTPGGTELNMLALFSTYFTAIRYWQDEDSGHWEETRKISASSIGVVVAGLLELQKLLRKAGPQHDLQGSLVTAEIVQSLIEAGRKALLQILPAECIQPDPLKRRRYDAALLFLIYPLQVVTGEMADRIVGDVMQELRGEIGISRYPLDSYWAPDYKQRLAPEQRTVDCSDDLSQRNQLLSGRGQEAQWCIFDPIISCIYGMKFKSTRSAELSVEQSKYLNRSLGQITGDDRSEVAPFRCPELYDLEDGEWVPNDHVPLLWTQANLTLALKFMEESCQI